LGRTSDIEEYAEKAKNRERDEEVEKAKKINLEKLGAIFKLGRQKLILLGIWGNHKL